MKQRGAEQKDQGEALTLDGFVNAIDAELIATGPSAKGPNRGALTRHGRFVLWSFEGPVSEMTEAGKALFINTLYFTARSANTPVLERRLGETRDDIHGSLDFIKHQYPGFLSTFKSFLPNEVSGNSVQEIEKWYEENRPYLRVTKGPFYNRFEVDTFARSLGIPNHKKAYLEKCIQNLESNKDPDQSTKTLKQYTGQNFSSAAEWKNWYKANKDYLYFSDCSGFKFIIDDEAKKRRIPTAKLRKWSSESIDFRYKPVSQ